MRDAATRPLEGQGIMVTRPVPLDQTLRRMIATAGGRAIPFPVLEILAPRDPQRASALMRRLGEFHMAVFVSRNAVQGALDLLHSQGLALPGGLRLAAIGRATAAALERAGYPVHIVPDQAYSSEALLAEAPMRDLGGQRVMILRGEGGRTVLGEQLRGRGAQVVYAELYRRGLPDLTPDDVRNAFLSQPLHLITVTSGEALKNLCVLARRGPIRELYDYPLLTGGPRVAGLAAEAGFQRVLCARDPSDQAMLQAIQDWAREAR
jgi:uroporphyrinogen-III synthase